MRRSPASRRCCAHNSNTNNSNGNCTLVRVHHVAHLFKVESTTHIGSQRQYACHLTVVYQAEKGPVRGPMAATLRTKAQPVATKNCAWWPASVGRLRPHTNASSFSATSVHMKVATDHIRQVRACCVVELRRHSHTCAATCA